MIKGEGPVVIETYPILPNEMPQSN